jgi:tetratricopeptide (TPR) repeat protein
MKLSSAVSLATVLALSAPVMFGAAPALAAKKEKPAKAPSAKFSPAFQKAAAPIQVAIKAQDFAGAKAALAAAAPLATTPDDKYFAGAMLLEISRGTKDTVGLRKGINEMITSGSPLASNMAELYLNSGKIAYELQDYNDAIAKLAEAERLGSKDTNIHLLTAEALFKTNRNTDGLTSLSKAIAAQRAAGQAVPESWFRKGTSVAYKSKDMAATGRWSRDLVRGYPTSQNWRDALTIYRDSMKLDGQLQLDLFRLMRDAKALAGERDFYEYGALATERAMPGEAKSVIEEGYASGAVSRTSVAVRERLAEATGKIPADRASVASDEKRAAGAGDGKLAANTGAAYLAYADNAKAIELLKLAQKKGGIDADAVNTRLGIAQARSGMKADARKAFEAVTSGSRRDIAQFWLLWLDLNP